MPTCRWCGVELAAGVDLCPRCGHFYEDTVPCPRCGTDVPKDGRLCFHCGHLMDRRLPEQRAAAPGPQAVPPMPPDMQPGVVAPPAYAPPQYASPPTYEGPGQYSAAAPVADPPQDAASSWVTVKPPGYTDSYNARTAKKLEYGQATDPVYSAATGMALMSLIFLWLPRVDIILAAIAILICGFGIYRHYVDPDRYGHFWLNLVAGGLGVIGLLVGIWFTGFAEHAGRITMLILHAMHVV